MCWKSLVENNSLFWSLTFMTQMLCRCYSLACVEKFSSCCCSYVEGEEKHSLCKCGNLTADPNKFKHYTTWSIASWIFLPFSVFLPFSSFLLVHCTNNLLVLICYLFIFIFADWKLLLVERFIFQQAICSFLKAGSCTHKWSVQWHF